MRVMLFLGYYGLAMLFGFLLRGRFDQWMYAKPHMQERLIVWAADAVSHVEQGGEDPLVVPLTVDPPAWSPVMRATPLGRFVRAAADPGRAVPDASPPVRSGRPPERAVPIEPGTEAPVSLAAAAPAAAAPVPPPDAVPSRAAPADAGYGASAAVRSGDPV